MEEKETRKNIFVADERKEGEFIVPMKVGQCCCLNSSLAHSATQDSVRFSGRGVCDAKSLVSTDVPISKVGALLNFHELRFLRKIRIIELRKELETYPHIGKVFVISSFEKLDSVIVNQRCRGREEINNEDMDIASGLLKDCGVDEHTGIASIFGCAKADEADVVRQLTPFIGVEDDEDTVAKLIEWPRLKGSRVEYPTSSNRFREFCKGKSSIDGIWGRVFAYRGQVWNDNLLWVSGEYLQRSDEEPLELNNITIIKVLRKEFFIDAVAREGTELEVVLKELEINGQVDVATTSSTVVRNLAKRKAIKRGAAPHSVTSVSVDDSSKRRKVTSPTKSQEVLEESDKIAEGVDLRLRFEVNDGLLEEQC
ncbi:hypothetical protein GIB67_039843 [Kingdonia uniflora]|uniref:Uncharacterized protein n=1 Tax=Kingdonia uniflora TaxID=39325 RepID=A0A7J7P3Q9_9MAGN|nr:hypothetical protein GIB67_039843 [Kingdonia uniflora]